MITTIIGMCFLAMWPLWIVFLVIVFVGAGIHYYLNSPPPPKNPPFSDDD